MMELLAGGREDDKVRRRTSRKIQPSDKVTSAKGDALTSKQEEIPNKQEESQDDHHLSEDLSQMWLAASILGPKMGYLLSCLSFFFIACFVCLLRQMVRYDDCTDNK